MDHSQHNHDDSGMKSMMWMMVLCCALPLLFIVFFGAGGRALGASTWVIIGGIIVMVGIHWFMMRGHGKSDHSEITDQKQDKAKESEEFNDTDHDHHNYVA